MTAEASSENIRRVRPWIAALLTLLFGWGMGFYYARRTKAAIWWSVAQVVVGAAIAAALFAYMAATGRAPPFFNPESLTSVDIVGWGLAALVAIVAWIATAGRQQVERAGPVRLLGYLTVWLLPLVAALVLAFSVRFFYLQPFRIPSGAMQPTLQVGDYIMVSKRSYGYGPYSTAPLDGLIAHRTNAERPQRGDIVVFRPPHELDRDFVKRVVGLPGERVQMIDGVLHINGAPVLMESLGEMDFLNGDGYRERIPAYRETLPGGVTHTIFDRNPRGELDNTRVFVVPEGHYFMMGDDRDNSDDSRYSVGFVPFDNLVGRVDRIVRQQGR